MPEDVANIGENIISQIVWSHRWINFVSPFTLDRLAEHLLTLSSGFKLESLPPTAAGANFHAFLSCLSCIATMDGEQFVSD